MKFENFSPKQLTAMLWWELPEYKHHDAIVCDGSVRSGKTMAMSIGFILWSMKTFDGETFAFCGKTIDSLKRNVIVPMQKWLGGIVKPKINLSRNFMEIDWLGHHNRYYFFGGKDERSYAVIQGATLAGVLLDEVALMPKSFVDQAIARCSVKGSKMWFNCNPDGSEEHWFFKDWIDDVNGSAGKKNRLHLHFMMEDNYALSETVRQRYESLYTGAFYERYVLGRWRAAEGIIYPMFSREHHVIPDKVPSIGEGEYYLSCDYGTLNPTSIGLWHLSPHGYAVKVREYYYDARKEGLSRTDEEHYAELEKLAGNLIPFIRAVIVDPSAASFIACIRRHGKLRVWKADNNVVDGIRDTAVLLQLGQLKFCERCKDTIREFGLYRWDDKSSKDTVVKENDHAMDETRYFVRTVMKKRFREIINELDPEYEVMRRND